jgi:hypothetical protein
MNLIVSLEPLMADSLFGTCIPEVYLCVFLIYRPQSAGQGCCTSFFFCLGFLEWGEIEFTWYVGQ